MSEDSPEGLAFDILCEDVPVVELTKKSRFWENATWMLQEVIHRSCQSVEQHYVDCNDADIRRDLDQKGISGQVVRLKDWPDVRAVGTTGKRSVMLALCVARCLKYPREVLRMYDELTKTGLYDDFSEMVSILERYMGEAAGDNEDPPSGQQVRESDDESEEEERLPRGERKRDGSLSPPSGDRAISERANFPEYGIYVLIVCGTVPVVGMDKASMFSEHASWLLQTALGWSGKADSLFKWDANQELVKVCKQAGLTDAEIFPARISHQPWVHIRAVGTGGKRSVMLAMVFALIIHGEVDFNKIKSAMPRFCDSLIMPMCRIAGAIGRLSGKIIPGIDSDGGPNSSAVRSSFKDSADKHLARPTFRDSADNHVTGPTLKMEGPTLRKYAEPLAKKRRETYGQGIVDDWWRNR